MAMMVMVAVVMPLLVASLVVVAFIMVMPIVVACFVVVPFVAMPNVAVVVMLGVVVPIVVVCHLRRIPQLARAREKTIHDSSSTTTRSQRLSAAFAGGTAGSAARAASRSRQLARGPSDIRIRMLPMSRPTLDRRSSRLDLTSAPGEASRFPPLPRLTEAVARLRPHDGSAETLDDVLDHYARGGREVTEVPWAGDGATNPNKHPRITGFDLSADDRAALMAFFDALTDRSYLTDSTFGQPE